MSIKIMAMLWDTRGHFSATEKAILLKIADSASEDGGNAYPGAAKIAACCEISRSSVFENLSNIYKTKVLKKRNRIKDGKLTSNIYAFDLKRLQWMVDNPVDNPVDKRCKSQGK